MQEDGRPHAGASVLIQGPRTGRELIDAFRLYDASTGLDGLLGLMDLATMSPHQAVHAVLGRLPEAGEASPMPGYDPRTHLTSLLNGIEFQKKILSRVLRSYVDKQRLLFIHVPKCAGSDLSANLASRTPALNFRLAERNWYPTLKMFTALKVLADSLAYAERIFVHGHIPLKRHVADDLVRFGDRVFTIVRTPLDMVISRINYILHRFSRDADLKGVDTRDWLRFLDYDKVRAAIATRDYRDVAVQILHTPQLVQRNTVCHFLGEGNAMSAIDLCARADVEIVHVRSYRQWLQSRWGIASDSRVNASQPVVSMAMLGDEARRFAEELISEDQLFVERVEQTMGRLQRCYVTGPELCG